MRLSGESRAGPHAGLKMAGESTERVLAGSGPGGWGWGGVGRGRGSHTCGRGLHGLLSLPGQQRGSQAFCSGRADVEWEGKVRLKSCQQSNIRKRVRHFIPKCFPTSPLAGPRKYALPRQRHPHTGRGDGREASAQRLGVLSNCSQNISAKWNLRRPLPRPWKRPS